MALTYSELGHCRLIDFGAGAEWIELAEVCEQVAWDEEARVVVVALGPEASHQPNPTPGGSGAPGVDPVARLKQPVIAAIRGDATGTGLELALACDIRIGVENARFGFTDVREGRVPSNGGTQRLPRLVGRGKAMEMLLTGELIDAAEACRIGLLNRVVAPDRLTSSATEMAVDMAAQSPLSLSYVKEALYSGRDLTLEQGLRMELDLYLLLFTASDRSEGIAAFREKRKPHFEGH